MEELHPESFDSLKGLLSATLGSSGELERWLESAGYADIVATVRPTRSRDVSAESLLRALDRRGLIDDTFFTRLIERLPEHAAEITRLARDLGVQLPDVSAPLEFPDYPSSETHPWLGTAAGDEPATADFREYSYALPAWGSSWSSPPSIDEPTSRVVQAGEVGDQGLRLPELRAVLNAARSVVQILDDRKLPVASGGLIGNDLLIVPDYVSDMVDGGGRPVTFARLERVDEEPEFARVLEVVASDSRLGLGVCRLDVTLGPGIDVVDVKPQVGTHLTLLHFPMGGSMRIGRAAVTASIDSVTEYAPTVAYHASTAPGSGGGLLVDGAGRLVAVNHSRTGTGPCLGILSAAVIALLRHHPQFNDLLASLIDPSTIVAVDPGLDARFSGPDEHRALPVLVRLQSPVVDLSRVDGVDVSSKLGQTVAATITKEGLDAIRHRPDVLAIDLSRHIGTRELFKSMPAIGWALPHASAERGEECLVAVIDEGVDVRHGSFVVDGRTKVEVYWDQTSGDSPCRGVSPEAELLADELNLQYGALYLSADIDAIRAGETPDTLPAAECTMHGTAVASIAAGVACGEGVGMFPGGVAPERASSSCASIGTAVRGAMKPATSRRSALSTESHRGSGGRWS